MPEDCRSSPGAVSPRQPHPWHAVLAQGVPYLWDRPAPRSAQVGIIVHPQLALRLMVEEAEACGKAGQYEEMQKIALAEVPM
jgi:hypothetical protein